MQNRLLKKESVLILDAQEWAPAINNIKAKIRRPATRTHVDHIRRKMKQSTIWSLAFSRIVQTDHTEYLDSGIIAMVH